MLSQAFYHGNDVTNIARQLLGKLLITNVKGVRTSGFIVETEAYSGAVERGSHAYLMKKTPRTNTLFEPGGIAYVYLCYGIHHLFNVVTNTKGQPDAVLIRAVEPNEGLGIMQERRGMNETRLLSNGPGKLSGALGISVRAHNAMSLNSDQIWIEEGRSISDADVAEATRIGIDYAGEDALLPWRYYLKDNPFVSRF